MSAFKNLVLVASAGTGKTHTLTSLLLRTLLVDDVPAPRVVATTFSRKAAGELRERLEQAMVSLRDGTPNPFEAGLSSSFEDDPARLAERARAAVPTLPHVHVTTMHALFLDMLAIGSRALGEGRRLELLDEDELRADDDEIAYALVEARANSEDPLEVETMEALVDAAGGLPLFVTTVIDFLRDVEEADRDIATLQVTNDEAAIQARVEEVVAFARRADVLTSEKLGDAAREIDAAFRTPELVRQARALDAFRAIPATGKADVVKAFKRQKDAWSAPWGELWLAAPRFGPLARAFVEFLAAVHAERRARIARTGRIGFGDVLRLSKELLLADVAFARSFGGKFDVLLVDEFQDTSPLQRELLALLWEDPKVQRAPGQPASLASVRKRGLAIVGDRKQAIYGFRGADVSVFGEVAVALAGSRAAHALKLPEPAHEPTSPAKFDALRDNYRSVPGVLAFVNALSAKTLVPLAAPAEPFEIDYAATVEDLRTPPRAHPELPSSREVAYWLTEVGKDDESQADAIAREIAGFMHDERAAGRTLHYRDFAILARTNATVDTCAAVLTAYGIPVVVGGTRFYRTQEVGDVRAVLELLALEDSALAAAEVLRGPVASLLDQSLIELKQNAPLGQVGRWDPACIGNAMDRERVAEVQSVLLRLRALAARTPPEELLALAITQLGLRSVWAGLSGGELRLANVAKLLGIARRFRTPDAMARFLRVAWNDDAKRESQAATFRDDDDAVRVLTIHASKGLAFPIVFVPRIEWPPPPSPTAFVARAANGRLSLRLRDRGDSLLPAPSWEDVAAHAKRREAAERRRLLYVAVTRAARHLVFVGGLVRKNDADPDATPKGEIAHWLSDLALPQRPAPLELAPVLLVEASSCVAAERTAPLAAPRRLRVTPTAVQDFVLCPRRYVFAHVLALPEERPAFALPRRPPADSPAASEAPALAAREEGTRMHRLLETVDPRAFGAKDAQRWLLACAEPDEHGLIEPLAAVLQSPYAREIATRGARLDRERAFSLRRELGEGAVLVTGSMDLVVTWPDGNLDVIDYKRSKLHSIERYRTQVALYRAAVQDAAPAARVRAGLWSLEDTAPHFFSEEETASASAEVDAVLPRFLRESHAPDTSRQPESYCLRIRCGFRPRCHSTSGSPHSNASMPEASQNLSMSAASET